MAWNDAPMVFLNFLNFFAIFLEFSITRRVGTKQNDKFLFSLFLGLFQPSFALNDATMVFFNFLNICPIFLEFSIMRQVGTEWNRTIIFIFSLFRPIPTYYGLIWNHNGILKFSEFYCYFFGIFCYASGKNQTER